MARGRKRKNKKQASGSRRPTAPTPTPIIQDPADPGPNRTDVVLKKDIWFDVFFGDLTPEILNNFITSKRHKDVYLNFRYLVKDTWLDTIGLTMILVGYYVSAIIFSKYLKPYKEVQLWLIPELFGRSVKHYIPMYMEYSTPVFRIWMTYILTVLFTTKLLKTIVFTLSKHNRCEYRRILGRYFWFVVRQKLIMPIHVFTAAYLFVLLWKQEIMQAVRIFGGVSFATALQKQFDWLMAEFPNVFVFLTIAIILSDSWIFHSFRYCWVLDIALAMGLQTLPWKAYNGMIRFLEIVVCITTFDIVKIFLSYCQPDLVIIDGPERTAYYNLTYSFPPAVI